MASVAQSDVRPADDQENTGLIYAGYCNILSWRLIWNIFWGHSFPSADSRRAVVSFWWKNVHKYWLTALRTKPAQEKVWSGELTVLYMTQMGWLGHNFQHKQKYVVGTHLDCIDKLIQFREVPTTYAFIKNQTKVHWL